MSVAFFEGPAGSGKTTRLIEKLAAALTAQPLQTHQQVLALTKMHGSRRRMHTRLESVPGLARRFSCTTLDSFAWRLVQRWRTLSRAEGWSEPTESEYDKVCARAGALLQHKIVREWVTRTFPIVAVDEMQDSKGGQLDIVLGLAESAVCFVAADEFQDLDAAAENAAVAWARAAGTVTPLSKNHRTNIAGLLDAAKALRNGASVPHKGAGFTILAAFNANVGASHLSRNISWWWGKSKDIAIISPVGPDASPFVHQVIERVAEAPFKPPKGSSKGSTGPYRIPWEVSQDDDCQRFLNELGLPSDPGAEITPGDVCCQTNHSAGKALRLWFDQQRALAGRTQFSVRDIQARARAIHHHARVHRRFREQGLRAMTVHQAKNREFDSVIVLWPYEVVGSPERKRRLLYNAITRAKRQALVVVQNPAKMKESPFTAMHPEAAEDVAF